MKADEGFVLTPLAVGDLNEIWDYLAEDSLEVADRVLLTIEKTLHRLALHPGIGHLREDLADKRHRFLLVHSYLDRVSGWDFSSSGDSHIARLARRADHP